MCVCDRECVCVLVCVCMLVCTVGVTVIPLLTLEPVHVGVVQAHTTLVAKRQIYSMPNPPVPLHSP